MQQQLPPAAEDRRGSLEQMPVLPQRVLFVVDGTAAMLGFWSSARKYYIDPLLRAMAQISQVYQQQQQQQQQGQQAGGKPGPAPAAYHMCLIVFYTADLSSECTVERTAWTTSVNEMREWMGALEFVGGEQLRRGSSGGASAAGAAAAAPAARTARTLRRPPRPPACSMHLRTEAAAAPSHPPPPSLPPASVRQLGLPPPPPHPPPAPPPPPMPTRLRPAHARPPPQAAAATRPWLKPCLRPST